MQFILEKSGISTEILNHDHLGFVNIINDFYEALYMKMKREKFIYLLDEFETYAVAHFEAEEKYYKIYNFSNIELKIIKNEILLEKLKDCKNSFFNRKIDEKELLVFFLNWLLVHFKEHDIIFDNFLKENNLNLLFQLDQNNHLLNEQKL